MHLDESHSKPPKSEFESSKHWGWGGGWGQEGIQAFISKDAVKMCPGHRCLLCTSIPMWCSLPARLCGARVLSHQRKDLEKVNSRGFWVGTGSQG